MTAKQEMMIPKSPRDVIFQSVITAIIVFFAGLAVVNIFSRVAIIPSLIWLTFITMILWTPVKKAGSFRRFLADCLGELIGRHFVEVVSGGTSTKEIRFGYELFGRRFIKKSIGIDKIESIYWSTGQASGMAGRDMNDWQICLWFDHCDPAKSEKKSKWHKPDQDIYTVGSARRKKITEAFGLSFVTFLRTAGAQLVQGEISSCFARSNPETK